jgi:hypothetical protein
MWCNEARLANFLYLLHSYMPRPLTTALFASVSERETFAAPSRARMHQRSKVFQSPTTERERGGRQRQQRGYFCQWRITIACSGGREQRFE